ncbi:MAG: hypothetical protein MUO85_00430 [candidate division Zixibacteria bacterium]|nr:hypothetical protein [candidate division Zixibacteria bacterium]
MLALMHVLKLCFILFKMDFNCKLAEAEAIYGVVTAQMIKHECWLKALQRSYQINSIGQIIPDDFHKAWINLHAISSIATSFQANPYVETWLSSGGCYPLTYTIHITISLS